jgi:hypothetical protein
VSTAESLRSVVFEEWSLSSSSSLGRAAVEHHATLAIALLRSGPGIKSVEGDIMCVRGLRRPSHSAQSNEHSLCVDIPVQNLFAKTRGRSDFCPDLQRTIDWPMVLGQTGRPLLPRTSTSQTRAHPSR